MTHEALAAVVAERRSSPTPTELAGELGLTYHQLYALMRDNGITGAQKSRRGDIRLSRDDVALLRVHHSRIADLNRRSMPLSVAAVELGVPVAVLETALRRGGVLDLDEEASTPTARLVTRESVAAYAKTRRRAAAPVPADAATVSAVQARAITGLTRPGLASLVQAGILVTVSRDRRMCVTRASIVTWAERCGRDDILPRLRQLADG